jgi:WD40 repeat protein
MDSAMTRTLGKTKWLLPGLVCIALGIVAVMVMRGKSRSSPSVPPLKERRKLEGRFGSGAKFSPDGTMLIPTGPRGDGKGPTRILDARSGAKVAEIDGSGPVAFSSDGSFVAVGSSRGVVIWEVATQKELRVVEIPQSTKKVQVLALSPYGRVLAVGWISRSWIHLFDLTSAELLLSIQGDDHGINSLQFSPDGKTLASAGYNMRDHSGRGRGDLFWPAPVIILWDVATGEKLKTIPGAEIGVKSVDFSPEGDRLAMGCFDGTIRIWDLTQDKELRVLRETKGEAGQVRHVAFSPSGRTVASGHLVRPSKRRVLGWLQRGQAPPPPPGAVSLWDVATGEQLKRVVTEDWVTSVAFFSDGKTLVSVQVSGTVTLWKVDEKE